MSGLLTNSQLTALSNLVKRGMTTDVLIYDHEITESATGTGEEWVARSSTVKGWLYTTNEPVMKVGSGLQGTVSGYRLYLELGTDITSADRVLIEGSMFTVEDTTHENTIQAMLTVQLRRIK